MNYYFPYGTMPYIEQATKTGLLSKIFRNEINWSTILSPEFISNFYFQ